MPTHRMLPATHKSTEESANNAVPMANGSMCRECIVRAAHLTNDHNGPMRFLKHRFVQLQREIFAQTSPADCIPRGLFGSPTSVLGVIAMRLFRLIIRKTARSVADDPSEISRSERAQGSISCSALFHDYRFVCRRGNHPSFPSPYENSFGRALR
jgi:hypothetical protein